MRMAGQALRPYVDPGQGCAKKPEQYPAQPQGPELCRYHFEKKNGKK